MEFDRLGRYLEEKIAGFSGPISATAFDDGQSNPTYKLSTPSGTYVLRKQPPGPLLKGAHAVDREFRVQQALWDTDVPVARMLHLCPDAGVIGTIFYVMEYVPGRVFWDPALPELEPAQRAHVYDQMNTVLAAIHNVDLAAVGLETFGRHGEYFSRQLHIWTRQYRDSGGGEIAGMNRLIEWLSRNMPSDDDRTTLVHGDFRIDNMIFDPVSLDLRAVFDWELSTLGHPLADLAYQMMQRRMGRDWYLRGLEGLDLTNSGIPSEQEYVEAYCARRGHGAPENWAYAKIFAFFRFAAICHGVGARGAAGNNASPDALKVGAMASPLVEMAVAQLDAI